MDFERGKGKAYIKTLEVLRYELINLVLVLNEKGIVCFATRGKQIYFASVKFDARAKRGP